MRAALDTLIDICRALEAQIDSDRNKAWSKARNLEADVCLLMAKRHAGECRLRIQKTIEHLKDNPQ